MSRLVDIERLQVLHKQLLVQKKQAEDIGFMKAREQTTGSFGGLHGRIGGGHSAASLKRPGHRTTLHGA